MKLKSILLTLFSFICSFLYGQVEQSDVDSLASFGLVNLIAQNYVNAIDASYNLIERSPNNPKGYFLRGLVKYKAEDFKGAQEDFGIVIYLDRSIVDGWRNRGLCKFALGKFKEAIQDYDTALSIDPLNSSIYTARAQCWNALGEGIASLSDYNRALILNENNIEALNDRARLHYHLGQYTLSFADFSKLININPSDPVYYIGRGEANHSLGRIAEALQDFQRAIYIDPLNWQGYFCLGFLHESQKDTIQAFHFYTLMMNKCIIGESFYQDYSFRLNNSALLGPIVYSLYDEIRKLAKSAVSNRRSLNYFKTVLLEEGYSKEEVMFAEVVFKYEEAGGLVK